MFTITIIKKQQQKNKLIMTYPNNTVYQNELM